MDVARWVKVTAAAGALGWAVGMTLSSFHAELATLPVPMPVVAGGSGAAVLLCTIGRPPQG